MREPDVQAAAAKSEPVRVDGDRKRELPQGVADWIVEPVADDGEIGKGPYVADEVDEGRIDGDRVEELHERGAGIRRSDRSIEVDNEEHGRDVASAGIL